MCRPHDKPVVDAFDLMPGQVEEVASQSESFAVLKAFLEISWGKDTLQLGDRVFTIGKSVHIQWL